jgi:hypothetical protein
MHVVQYTMIQPVMISCIIEIKFYIFKGEVLK